MRVLTFTTALDDGTGYAVTVLTQPNDPDQNCSVSNGSGTLVGTNVIDVVVNCVMKSENIFTNGFE